jgi:phosphoribosylamine--glycine ligase
MNILIVGNGGREHALAWKIKQSKRCGRLYVAPGNGGTAAVAENVSIPVDDFPRLGTFCLENKIELVVVGPEGPLVNGIRDYFEADPHLKNILMIGPGRDGAQLEGSKDFSKQFMVRHRIPTAEAKTFQVNQMKEALHYLETRKPPIVLKADGLASGKGVIISPSVQEAQQAIREMLEERKFGLASAKVLVEEFLDGIEVSVFVLTDGTDYLILPEAKDYKRIGEGDTGPNTGGMGAVSPVVFANAVFMKKVEERVIKPTIAGLQKESIPYKGFIFIGVINVKGDPYVIEYNARLGDPETEVVLPRIKNDLVDLFVATAKGELKEIKVEQESFCAVTVVLVSGGYPGDYQTGKTISGLETATDALVFHAGTKRDEEKVRTAGGRVLAVTGRGADLKEASKNAYEGISGIGWDRLYFRKDIGLDLQNWRD